MLIICSACDFNFLCDLCTINLFSMWFSHIVKFITYFLLHTFMGYSFTILNILNFSHTVLLFSHGIFPPHDPSSITPMMSYVIYFSQHHMVKSTFTSFCVFFFYVMFFHKEFPAHLSGDVWKFIGLLCVFSLSQHSEGRPNGMKTEENQSCLQQAPSSTPFGEKTKYQTWLRTKEMLFTLRFW